MRSECLWAWAKETDLHLHGDLAAVGVRVGRATPRSVEWQIALHLVAAARIYGP
jgi:hypothetical protein